MSIEQIAIGRVSFAALGDEWHTLTREGYHDTYAGMGEMYGGVVSVEDKIEQMRRWGEGILAWTARDGRRLIGLLTGDLDGDRLTIYDLFVDAAYRRQGIGRALLEAALAEPGVRRVATEINMDNAASRALFESEGFRPAVVVGWFVRGRTRLNPSEESAQSAKSADDSSLEAHERKTDDPR